MTCSDFTVINAWQIRTNLDSFSSQLKEIARSERKIRKNPQILTFAIRSFSGIYHLIFLCSRLCCEMAMMFSSISSSLLQSFLLIPKLSASETLSSKRNHSFVFSALKSLSKGNHDLVVSGKRVKTFPIHLSLRKSNEVLGLGNRKTTSSSVPKPGFRFVCFYDAKEKSEGNFPEKAGSSIFFCF